MHGHHTWLSALPMRASRIALLLPDLGGGGAERVAATLANAFVERGHRVDLLLARHQGVWLDQLDPAVRVIDLEAPRLRQVVRPLTSYLRREQPDGLLSFMWPLNIFAVLAGVLARSATRIVVTDHIALSQQYASWGPIHRSVLKRSIAAFYPRAAARVVVSQGARNDLASLAGLAIEALEVIHNPVPAPIPLPASTDRIDALWGGPGPRTLTAGSLKSQKNHALLIRSFASLPRSDARLMILGEGALRAELAQLAMSLGILDRVVMPGFASDPWPYYASADLFVLSSDYEGFANVVAEALQAGLPVVSTDSPHGPREILDDGRFGRLVPVGDVTALAEAIAAELMEKPDKERLKQRGACFGGHESIARYEALLLASGRSTA